jgi:hypothetical protein
MRTWVVVGSVVGVLCLAGVARAVDCDGDRVADAEAIAAGAVPDCNANGVPDSCDVFPLAFAASSVADPPNNPLAVAAADLDGDGDVDLATVHPGSDKVRILLNQGDGTFTAGDEITVGDQPVAIVAAFLRTEVIILAGGSLTDLVVANAGGNTVTILENQGDGTFLASAASPLTVGMFPSSVAVADVNGDTEPDIVVANRTSSTITLFTGDGMGAFGLLSSGPVAGGPQAILLADADGDFKPDLFLAARTAGQVVFTPNMGGGPTTIATFDTPFALAVGDVNGDGALDVAASSLTDGGVRMIAGHGDGTFTALGTVAVGGIPASLALADLDGDGRRDLVVGDLMNDAVVVALGRGDGTFGPVLHQPAGDGVAALAVSDFDLDARLDVATANGAGADVTVLRQLATPPVADCNATGIPDTCELAGADCNANGVPDTCDVTAHLAFGPSTDVPLTLRFLHAAAGDVDGDRDVDVVGVDTNGLVVLKNDGTGTLAVAGTVPLAGGPERVALVDLEPDGDLDAAVTLNSNKVIVVRNAGDGTFTPDVSPGVGTAPRDVVTADIDGDHDPDLLVANSTASSVSVVRNDGAAFTPVATVALAGLPLRLVAGDLDGDGDPDAAVLEIMLPSTTEVQILRNAGGTLTAEAPILPLTVPDLHFGLEAADLDGDDDADLVLADVVNGSSDLAVSVLRNDRAGGFVETARRWLPGPPFSGNPLLLAFASTLGPRIVAGDFDGDGHPDIATVDPGALGLRVFRGGGDATIAATTVPAPIHGNLTFPFVGDVNGDGAADLLAPSRTSPNVVHVVRSLARPTSRDCAADAVPDECQLAEDCNANAVPDACELMSVDADADGVPDCIERDAACGNCRDDDGDGAIDLGDPSCPSTPLTMKKVAAAGKKRKQVLRITAELPVAYAGGAGDPRFTVVAGGRALVCEAAALKHGKGGFKLAAAHDVLKALALTVKKKTGTTRLRATVQGESLGLTSGATVEVSLATGQGAWHGTRTLPARRR